MKKSAFNLGMKRFSKRNKDFEISNSSAITIGRNPSINPTILNNQNVVNDSLSITNTENDTSSTTVDFPRPISNSNSQMEVDDIENIVINNSKKNSNFNNITRLNNQNHQENDYQMKELNIKQIEIPCVCNEQNRAMVSYFNNITTNNTSFTPYNNMQVQNFNQQTCNGIIQLEHVDFDNSFI